jgi:hypothetical protein
MDARLHLFGIRHHGPGSAASLVKALEALRPDAVLIEGPPEANPLIQFVATPGMRPPVALLGYAADEASLAAFYPYALFSPEWQAMRWALRHERPVRFIDWPAAMALAFRRELEPAPMPQMQAKPGAFEGEVAAEETALDGEEAAADAEALEPEPPEPVRRDPLDRLAAASGHADGEALWNALVESRGAAESVFAQIEEAMTTLRAEEDETPSRDAPREAIREAHMRLEIKKALSEHEGAIAVVVGAWHVPALRRKASAEDRALLKAAPRCKVEITFVPWTETRLAAASGYGAGVASPGWYAHLWSLYQDAPAQAAPSGVEMERPAADVFAADIFAASWQSKVAGLLRAEGHTAAPASVIEAARLALALAAMRGQATPGLEEMRDATLAALCHGDATPFRLIEARLVIGEAVGALDASVPQTPLAAELAALQRRLRLKPSATVEDTAFDLRSEAGLAKSILLHRLALMGVPWGRLLDAGAGRGTFREIWRLVWEPELSVRLAEALVHGVTIEQASMGSALARARSTNDVSELAELVRRCLLADLPRSAEMAIARLQAAAVNAADIVDLMEAVPALASILRYGTARQMPTRALSELAKALIVEVCAGILLAASGLDEEAAETMRRAMSQFDAALPLIEDAHLDAEWARRLEGLAREAAVVPPVAGLALRCLYDRAALAPQAIAAAFSRALSPAVAPQAAGGWLEGFLGSSAEPILQDRALLELIDAYVVERDEEGFIELLPMLRRAFSSFGATERRRLLLEVGKAGRGEHPAPSVGVATTESEGFRKALPLLLTILGIERR